MATISDTKLNATTTQVCAKNSFSPYGKTRLKMLTLWVELHEGLHIGPLWLTNALHCSPRTAQALAKRALAGDWSVVRHGNYGRRQGRYGLASRLVQERGGDISAPEIRAALERLGVADIPALRTLRRWKREFLNAGEAAA